MDELVGKFALSADAAALFFFPPLFANALPILKKRLARGTFGKKEQPLRQAINAPGEVQINVRRDRISPSRVKIVSKYGEISRKAEKNDYSTQKLQDPLHPRY
jgi:hypothetical protein